MYKGERPRGAAKGKQTNIMASCHPPPPAPFFQGEHPNNFVVLGKTWLDALPAPSRDREGRQGA